MTGLLHIVIADPSDIIRRGVRSILQELVGDIAVTFTDAACPRQLCRVVASRTPDMLIATKEFAPFLSTFSSPLSPPILPMLVPSRTKMVMLVGAGEETDRKIAVEGRVWDGVISIGDPAAKIREKLTRIIGSGRFVRRHGPLSQREKDVVVCVVKGMTNRRIAELLHLSHHTVGTHRRNISAKLDIHTVAGLTVYAISNNLVRLSDLDLDNKPGRGGGGRSGRAKKSVKRD
jgi:DNA-binding NarL/FixJ family response regulator